MHMPQEYWMKKNLYEITFGIGTHVTIDEATQARIFGLYARVLVDEDKSSELFESMLVEREGHAFPCHKSI